MSVLGADENGWMLVWCKVEDTAIGRIWSEGPNSWCGRVYFNGGGTTSTGFPSKRAAERHVRSMSKTILSAKKRPMDQSFTYDEHQREVLAERGHQMGALPGWKADPLLRWYTKHVNGLYLVVHPKWHPGSDSWQWVAYVGPDPLGEGSTCAGPRQGMKRAEADAQKLFEGKS